MEAASALSSPLLTTPLIRITLSPKPITLRSRNRGFIRNPVRASPADPAQVEVSWQIIVGSIAGVTPFVVAGVEFTKRIVRSFNFDHKHFEIAQRRCEVCGGSGLILEENDYYKCPGCGGFLPWQSWKRFFSG